MDVLASQTGLGFLIFGVVGLVMGGVFLALANAPVFVLVGLFIAAGGVLALVLPVLLARHVSRALRFGVLTTADVIAIDSQARRSRESLDALRYGVAEGRRLVHHTKGDFEEAFFSDDEGASDLKVGSTMPVLVAPDKKRVLLGLPARFLG